MFKSINLPEIRSKVRLLADKRGSNFATDDEIDSLVGDQFDMLFMNLVQANEAYYLQESDLLKPVNKNEIVFPDDFYKIRMLKREDSFPHAVPEKTLQEVVGLDSNYFSAYWNVPTAYGYVLFPDRIKLFPRESVSNMSFRMFYARDPLTVQNETMQVAWTKFLSYKTAYVLGVIEENPRASLGDLALEWQQKIMDFASERNTGIRTPVDMDGFLVPGAPF